MFTVFPTIFTIMFVVVAGIILVSIIRGIGEWNHNNQSPVLTVTAKVTSKRTSVSHHTTAATDTMPAHTSTSTTYYVTFEVESGDRMEFTLKGREYGLLSEGDCGRLTFQGTRYQSFERSRGDGEPSGSASTSDTAPAQASAPTHTPDYTPVPTLTPTDSKTVGGQGSQAPAAPDIPASAEPAESSQAADGSQISSDQGYTRPAITWEEIVFEKDRTK